MRALAPAWLWLLAGAIPVVALYVLRSRRRRVRVRSTLLWAAAERDLLARAPWKRLVAEASLALELAAVLCLALAASRPVVAAGSAPAERVALVVDTSASMQAAEEGGPRIELARRAALALLERLPPGAEVTVVEAGRDVRVAAPLTRDRAALRRALASLRARDVEGSLGEAVSLAADRLHALPGRRRVVVVTDGAVARREEPRPSPVPVEVLRVGAPQGNAALVRLDARVGRGASGEEAAQVFALVAWFGERARDVELTVRRDDGAALGSRSARLEPGARTPVVVTFPLAAAGEGRGLVASLAPGDALAADDVAYARLPPGPGLPVVLAAAAESPWLRRALTADPSVTLQEVLPEDAAGAAPPGALVVFDGACPSPLPDRDLLVVAPPQGPCAGVTVGPGVEAPAVTSYATAVPRFRFLTMDGVHLASATPLALGPHATELLRSGAGVLFADAGTPDRVATVLGVDVARTDWPLRASFVVFVRNVVELSRARRARAASGGGRAGEPLRVPVPPRAAGVTAEGPAGPVGASVAGATAVVGDTSRAGLYRVRWRGGEALVPVNLLSDAESDLRAAPWEPPPAAASAARAAAPPSTELAPWLAALAALAVLADLWWLTRRAPPRAAGAA